jgi:hypothetical protein
MSSSTSVRQSSATASASAIIGGEPAACLLDGREAR